MNRYYGTVGYVEMVENAPSVWEEVITERHYYGDILRNSARFQASQNLNDDMNISNSISIVADPYAYNHFNQIRYITFMGSKWKVTNIEVQSPRLILTIGGVYNG